MTTQLNHPGRVKESIEESLAKLDYYDLYLVHWPQTVASGSDEALKNLDQPYQVAERPIFNETWVEMEQVLASGKVRAIGLSNFSIKTIEKLLETAKVVPAVNQIELHPCLAQPELLELLQEQGIYVTTYAPTGYASACDDPTIKELAVKHGASPTQVVLAWHITRGNAAVLKSQDPRRQKDNTERHYKIFQTASIRH